MWLRFANRRPRRWILLGAMLRLLGRAWRGLFG